MTNDNSIEVALDIIRRMNGRAWKAIIRRMYGFENTQAWSIRMAEIRRGDSDTWKNEAPKARDYTVKELASIVEYMGPPPFIDKVLNPIEHIKKARPKN